MKKLIAVLLLFVVPALGSLNDGRPSLGPQRRLIMLYNYQDNPGNQPFTRKQIDTVFDRTNLFYQGASAGRTSITQQQVTDWLNIKVDSMDCTTPTTALVEEEARAAGFDVDSYTDRVYLNPVGGCHSAGGATTTNIDSQGNYRTSTFLTGHSDFFSIAHEYGHTLGFDHSNSFDCPAGVIYSGDCLHHEYGDIYDIMGNFNVGFLPNAAKTDWAWWTDRVRQCTADEIYDIGPLEAPGNADFIAVKIAKTYTVKFCPMCTPIARSGFYYLEYRRPIGADVGLPIGAQGVLVHLSGQGTLLAEDTEATGSHILNMHPAQVGQPALKAGQSYTDSAIGVTITVLETTAEYARVSIDFTP